MKVRQVDLGYNSGTPNARIFPIWWSAFVGSGRWVWSVGGLVGGPVTWRFAETLAKVYWVVSSLGLCNVLERSDTTTDNAPQRGIGFASSVHLM